MDWGRPKRDGAAGEARVCARDGWSGRRGGKGGLARRSRRGRGRLESKEQERDEALPVLEEDEHVRQQGPAGDARIDHGTPDLAAEEQRSALAHTAQQQ